MIKKGFFMLLLAVIVQSCTDDELIVSETSIENETSVTDHIEYDELYAPTEELFGSYHFLLEDEGE